jgi:hypothetical protein
MDTSLQFVLIAKRILREMSVLSETVRTGFLGVQKQVEAVAKEQQTQNQREESPPVLRAELQIPEAIERERKRENHQKICCEWVAIGINVLTLFAVVAYALINYHMLCQMKIATEKAGISATAAKSAADTAHNTLVLSQRAWIGPGNPYFNIDHNVSKIMPNIPIHGNFTLENFGKIPATIDEIGVKFEARDSPVSEDAEYVVKPGKAVLFPTGRALTNDSVVTISPADFKAIRSKTKILVLHGIIRYHDTFGNHTTKLCLRWEGQDARSFEPCLEHNGAD